MTPTVTPEAPDARFTTQGEGSASLFSLRSSLIDTENAFKIGPRIAQVEAQGLRVIRCNLGEPDFPLPKHIAAEIKRQVDADNTHYCDPQGVLPLREAIARASGERRGLTFSPAQVVVFPGAKPPIGLSQEAYCDPGHEVIYPSPGFPIYESFTRYLGLVPVPLHLDESQGFTVDGKALGALITPRTKLIFLNFPSNPTGGVASLEQLEDLASVILAKTPETCRIYSDEVYEDILFDGARHHSIASIPGMASRTIIVGGVSKSYSWTGGRIGWAIFPTVEEAAMFKNLNINYFSCIPAYNQMAAKVAIESPLSLVAIDEMTRAFQQRRDMLVDRLNAIEGIRCQKPRGAFYLFPNIEGVCRRLGAIDAWEKLPVALKSKTSPSTMFQLFLLHRHGVATMDRKSFGRIGSEGKHFVRLSIATALADLEIAADRIATAAFDVEGFRSFIADQANLF